MSSLFAAASEGRTPGACSTREATASRSMHGNQRTGPAQAGGPLREEPPLREEARSGRSPAQGGALLTATRESLCIATKVLQSQK